MSPTTCEQIPRDSVVIGAGVIGLEYASMMAALGIKVTVVDQRPEVLEFIDHEIVEALCYHLRQQGVTFRLGEQVTRVAYDALDRVAVETASGKALHAESLLYTVGRQPNTDRLNLGATGITTDARGRIAVNEWFQTSVPHIYAAGDVIGFPALASTSMEQGRVAGSHLAGVRVRTATHVLPYGIYTIPEISMVGATERELTRANTPYETGIAKYEDVARGQIVGDRTGTMKLLFHPESLKLLGVHVIGENAAELIHIGQAVLTLGGTIEYFRDTVFNYPTLAEAYKVAALNGLNKL